MAPRNIQTENSWGGEEWITGGGFTGLATPLAALASPLQVQRVAVLTATGVGLFPLPGLTVVAAIIVILDPIFGFHVQLKFSKRFYNSYFYF